MIITILFFVSMLLLNSFIVGKYISILVLILITVFFVIYLSNKINCIRFNLINKIYNIFTYSLFVLFFIFIIPWQFILKNDVWDVLWLNYLLSWFLSTISFIILPIFIPYFLFIRYKKWLKINKQLFVKIDFILSILFSIITYLSYLLLF